MKNAIVKIGIIGTIIITIGAIFKLSKLSGGLIAIAIGSIFLAIYIFIYTLEKAKTFNTRIGKTYTIIFGITGMLMIIGFPLELIRWPGTNIIFIAFFMSFAGLLIISLVRIIYENNKELRYKYTNNFIFLLGGGTILLYPSILWILDKVLNYS
jgi:hypothetical protein